MSEQAPFLAAQMAMLKKVIRDTIAIANIIRTLKEVPTLAALI
jgi:hypothetical protein